MTVKGHLDDVRDAGANEAKSYSFKEQELKTASRVGWVADTSNLFYWLPNTVFIDFGSATTNFTINGVSAPATSQALDGPLGEAFTVVSAISLRRILPPIDRDTWSFRTSFVPTASFSYANEKFETVLGISGQTFHRLHTDVGWGPSFNYGSRSWNFYFNILPIFAFDQISTTAGGTTYVDNNAHITFAEEIGIMKYISQRWLVRLYERNVEVPRNTWENVIGNLLQTNVTINSAQVVWAGVAVGYVVPLGF